LLHWLLIAGILVTTLAPALPVVVIPPVDFATYASPTPATYAAADEQPARKMSSAAALPVVAPAPIQFVPAFIPQPGYASFNAPLPEMAEPVVSNDGAAVMHRDAPPRFIEPAAIWAPAAAGENTGAAWWQNPQAAILDASDPLWGDAAAAEMAAAAAPVPAWWQDPQAAILDASDPLWGDAAAETAAAAPTWWQDPQAFTLQLDGNQALSAAGIPGPFSGPSQESTPATLPAFGVCTSPITLTVESLTPLVVTQGDTLSAYTVTVVLTNGDLLTPTGPVTYTIALPANFFL
jgi:hypothetical protein